MNTNNNEIRPQGKSNHNNFLSGLFNNSLIVSILLLIVSFSVFVPSLSSEFVWDDITYIQKSIDRLQTSNIKLLNFFIPGKTSEQVRDRRQIRKAKKKKLKSERLNQLSSISNGENEAVHQDLSKNDGGKNKKGNKYFRPIHETSLILDAQLWGGNPLGFQLTNIILHSISTILLYFLFLLVLKEFGVSQNRPTAFLSAMLFALYPIHVESVSFISARGDVLAAVFFFLAFILYILSYRRFVYILPAVICLYLSFLSKEVAISFPIVFVGYDLVTGKIKSRRSLIKYLVLFLAVILYLLIRSRRHMNFVQMLGDREYLSPETGAQALEIITVFLNSYLFYLKKLIFPFDLNPFIGTIPGGDLLYTLISILVIGAAIAIFFISIRRKENITAFTLLWIFATLGPAVMTAIFPLAITRFAERFLYIPSAGMSLLLGYFIIMAGQRLGRIRLAYLVGTALCIIYLVFTLLGQNVWKNSLSLWEYAVLKSPLEIVPKMHYALALKDSGREDEALAQYMDALKPETLGKDKIKAEVAGEIGDIYLARGDYDQASKYYKTSFSLSPAYEEDYNYKMGIISTATNNPQTAEQYLLRVIELNPRQRNAYYVLGNIYTVRAQVENKPEYYNTAKDYLEIATSFKKSLPETNLLLAKIYVELGNIAKAKEQAQQAIDKGISANGLNEARSILNMNR